MGLDKTFRKAIISVFLIVVIIGLIEAIQLTQKGLRKELDYKFDGIVDSISYDIKGKASVVINGTTYYLGAPNWDFDHNRIQKGDSIIKQRNSMIIKLIKPTGQVILEGAER